MRGRRRSRALLYQGETKPGSTLPSAPVVTEPIGARWINAYVANAYEPVARSGPALPGEWHTKQRDRSVDLMTDGDQAGALVEGWYGDITLQAR